MPFVSPSDDYLNIVNILNADINPNTHDVTFCYIEIFNPRLPFTNVPNYLKIVIMPNANINSNNYIVIHDFLHLSTSDDNPRVFDHFQIVGDLNIIPGYSHHINNPRIHRKQPLNINPWIPDCLRSIVNVEIPITNSWSSQLNCKFQSTSVTCYFLLTSI